MSSEKQTRKHYVSGNRRSKSFLKSNKLFNSSENRLRQNRRNRRRILPLVYWKMTSPRKIRRNVVQKLMKVLN